MTAQMEEGLPEEALAPVPEEVTPAVAEAPAQTDAEPGIEIKVEAPADEFAAIADIIPEKNDLSIDAEIPPLASAAVTIETEQKVEAKADEGTAASASGTDESAAKDAEKEDEENEFAKRAKTIEALRQMGVPAQKAEQIADKEQEKDRVHVPTGAFGGLMSALTRKLFSNSTPQPAHAYSAEAMRERYAKLWPQAYYEAHERLDLNAGRLRDAVTNYNDAFAKSAGGLRLAEMAKAANEPFGKFVQDVQRGRLEDASAKTALADALTSPEVAKAWHELRMIEGEVTQAKREMIDNLGKVAKNFPDAIDPGIESERINDLMDKLATAPTPYAEGMDNPAATTPKPKADDPLAAIDPLGADANPFATKPLGGAENPSAGAQGKQESAQAAQSGEAAESISKEFSERMQKLIDDIREALSTFFARFAGPKAG